MISPRRHRRVLGRFRAIGLRGRICARASSRHITKMADIFAKSSSAATPIDPTIRFIPHQFVSEYGKLRKIKFEGNIAGGSARIDTDKYEKEDARDFRFGKRLKLWTNRVGKRRLDAVDRAGTRVFGESMKYLGETFDMHLAADRLSFRTRKRNWQSEGSTGKAVRALWYHVEH